MLTSYAARFACLLLSSFFALHFCLTLGVRLITPFLLNHPISYASGWDMKLPTSAHTIT
jgi:hypothetical protein